MRSSMYARALSLRAIVASVGGFCGPEIDIDMLRGMAIDVCLEGEPLPPVGDIFRDARRCSLRYCRKLLPAPLSRKPPSCCMPTEGTRLDPAEDGAISWP